MMSVRDGFPIVGQTEPPLPLNPPRYWWQVPSTRRFNSYRKYCRNWQQQQQ
ncbi:hypothetical protein [Limnospira platensis]|uniref:hypothetical protein n=1 Tax=Limnospira platensis TaxID=118562 RepID=UPI0001D0EEFE|nr:hypothetical protein AP9108_36020 [Arthrospira sp. PCC 9108]BAI92990.1 hypothetical protein NIES39_M01530 [Arthrospira platensis NIES-39]